MEKDIPQFAREGYLGHHGEILLRFGKKHIRNDSLLPKRWRAISGEKKMCFRNCAEAALENPDLLYVEGYARADIPLPFPIAHAWLLTPDELVVDPTWERGLEYFGITFTGRQLAEYLLLNEEYGLLDSISRSGKLRDRFLADGHLLEKAPVGSIQK